MDFALKLRDLGHKVLVVTPQDSTVPGIDICSFKSFTRESSLSHLSPKSLKGFLQLASVVIFGAYSVFNVNRKHNFDRILCFWAIPSGLISLPTSSFFRIPLDVWVLGSDVWDIEKYPLGRRVLTTISKRTAIFLADGWQLAIETNRITNIMPKFLPSARRSRGVPLENTKSQVRYLLYIGRLHPNKGIDILVSAFLNCCERYSEMPPLHIYGDGPLMSELTDQALASKYSEKLIFCGLLTEEDLPEIISNSICVVIPSRIESIPLILGQAALFAKRVILTDVGDMGFLAKEYALENICHPTVESIEEMIMAVVLNIVATDTQNLRALANFLSLDKSVEIYLKMIKNEGD